MSTRNKEEQVDEQDRSSMDKMQEDLIDEKLVNPTMMLRIGDEANSAWTLSGKAEALGSIVGG